MALSKSTYNDKVFYILGLFSLLLLIERGGAFEFKIGGPNGWTVPSDAFTQSYDQWAAKSRFKIGDTLLFVYPSNKDSVLQVTKEHYDNCTTNMPLAKFMDGHTVFKINHSGPFYFISGTRDNCMKNEKVHIVVLADRSGQKSSPPPPPLATAPAPVPSADQVPSPPAQSNPSPAPTSDQTQNQTPPNSGASSAVASVVALLGAFVGSSLAFGL